MVQSSKKIAKFLLKLALTVSAFWVVLSKVSPDQILTLLKKADFRSLLLAFCFFNLSKIVSAIRLNRYFSLLGLCLLETKNLVLYYIGMFYNLFLPGGIGGDGYKIYLLQKHHSVRTKSLIAATILDRISGLVPLLILFALFFLFSPFRHYSSALDLLAIFSMLLVIPVFYLINKRFFPKFLPVFSTTLGYGFAVQLLQLLCAWFLFLALGIDHMMSAYLALFLLSSVIAVLPITVGGAGARELVFLYGLNYLHMDSAAGVTFAMLFFLITALSSLMGAFFKNPFHHASSSS